MEEKIESPCIGVCTMNAQTGYCLGCYRTLQEIQGWWDMSESEKNQLIKILDARQAQDVDFD
jgi:hypothetical protein